MNVVVLMLDSLRPDFLGCGGHEICKTPRIDGLAAEGVFFENAYAEYPITVPSRTAMVSGNFTFTNRPWCPLRSYDMHIAEVLRDAGYMTAAFSDTPFREASNMHRGFDTFEVVSEGKCYPPVSEAAIEIPECYYPEWGEGRELTFWPATYRNRAYALETYGKACPELLFDKAIDWMEENHRSDFFLWIDSFDPHEPWAPVPPYDTMYQDGWERYIPMPLGPDASWMNDKDKAHVIANYMGDATHIDVMVGRVLDTIDKLGIREETAVLVVSDHGEPLCEHGTIRKFGVPLYDELSKIVFIARIPGVTPSGQRCGTLVENVDFAPTVASLLGVALPEAKGESDRKARGFDGRDLTPLLRGGADPVRDAVYIGAFGLNAGIRRDELKFIHNQGRKPNELYNLAEDPAEKSNLIDREPTLATELHKELGEFRSQWHVTLSWKP
jgi:arylsulfatase A-like enzyme